MSNHISKLPQALISDFENGSVVPFIGAGFSKNAYLKNEMMPDNEELAKLLAAKNLPSEYKFENSLKAFSDLEDCISRNSLIRSIKNELHINHVLPDETHYTLFRIPFKTICTTNFDNLIEDSFRCMNLDYNLVACCDDIPFIEPTSPSILKLHGDFQHISKLIITEKDYESYLENNVSMCNYLCHLFSQNTFVLIGYSFRDRNIIDLRNIVKDHFEYFCRPIYTILVGATSEEISGFKNQDIKIINLEGSKEKYPEILQELFKELLAICSKNAALDYDNPLIEHLNTTTSDDEICKMHNINRDHLEFKQKGPESQYDLGICYYNGINVPQDYGEAAKCFKTAAEQGMAKAQFSLGTCYYHGYGVPKDYEMSAKWIKSAAEQGLTDAQCFLGFFYYMGYGLPQDYDEAVIWYTSAAKKGHIFAQFSLGTCYYHGYGVPKDYEMSAKWIKSAAEQGMAEAQYALGLLYKSGIGVPVSYEQCKIWLNKSADQNYPMAQAELGNAYYHGLFGYNDVYKAFELFKSAAEGGEKNILYNLAMIYENELAYTEPDKHEKAAELYLKCAEDGNPDAQIKVAEMYEKGIGLPKDSEKMLFWYKQAAKGGNSKAQLRLGVIYAKGTNGIIPDAEEATKWFKWAAKQGNNLAENWLKKLDSNANH